MKLLNAFLLSAVLTLVAAPMAFGCPCNKNVSNEAFLKDVGRGQGYQGYQAPDVQQIREVQ